ncbi:MAG: histidine phosphatase family protein [Bacilli bacterium]|nr:histidine phosphatase family protein [Bacilli bacterium]
MTTVYLIRHSKALKVNNDLNKDELQIQNEKNCLSIEGEELAKNKMNNKELENIDILYSSNYVRAIQTAKYLADKNNLEINVISDLGERKFGFSSWDEKPTDFEMKQFLDENYKFGKEKAKKK